MRYMRTLVRMREKVTVVKTMRWRERWIGRKEREVRRVNIFWREFLRNF
jgi:hypothetical protein